MSDRTRRGRTGDKPTSPPPATGPTGVDEPTAAGPTLPIGDEPAGGAGVPPAAPPPTAPPGRARGVRRTRASALWTAVVGFALVLVLLLIFILQNLQQVKVSYFGAHGHLPLAVAMLLSAIGGALIVALSGIARILQLRRVARRQHQRLTKL